MPTEPAKNAAATAPGGEPLRAHVARGLAIAAALALVATALLTRRGEPRQVDERTSAAPDLGLPPPAALPPSVPTRVMRFAATASSPGAPDPATLGSSDHAADLDDDLEDDAALAERTQTSAPPDPVTVEDMLRYGSKEPLIPPVIELTVELAPGSVATAEPLTPPVLPAIDVRLAPGSVATAEPLTPKVIAAEPAAPAR